MRWGIPLLLCLCVQVQAGEIQVSGYLSAESTLFVSNPAFPGQFDGTQNALIAQPEFHYETTDRHNQYSLIPFAHLDSQDDRRTHADLREAWWMHIADNWELLVG